MSAYKQFNAQDLIVSPFEVNKNFDFYGLTFSSMPQNVNLTGSNVGIDRFFGYKGDYLISSSITTGNINSISVPLVYDSVQQLYYSNYISGSSGFTGDAYTSSIILGADEAGNRIIGGVQQTNYDNYDQTTLWPNRQFPTGSSTVNPQVVVISIPSKLFGDYIQPESFIFRSGSSIYKDDGEGRLMFKDASSTYSYTDSYGNGVGNIIYDHGIAILAGVGESWATSVIDITCSFSSSYKIFETQYKATVFEDEFNYSLNPSIVTGSAIPTVFSGSDVDYQNTASIGQPLDFATGSYFTPYITTVGLYNENYQLLAVGKLSEPLQSSLVTDTTILVNIDR